MPLCLGTLEWIYVFLLTTCPNSLELQYFLSKDLKLPKVLNGSITTLVMWCFFKKIIILLNLSKFPYLGKVMRDAIIGNSKSIAMRLSSTFHIRMPSRDRWGTTYVIQSSGDVPISSLQINSARVSQFRGNFGNFPLRQVLVLFTTCHAHWDDAKAHTFTPFFSSTSLTNPPKHAFGMPTNLGFSSKHFWSSSIEASLAFLLTARESSARSNAHSKQSCPSDLIVGVIHASGSARHRVKFKLLVQDCEWFLNHLPASFPLCVAIFPAATSPTFSKRNPGLQIMQCFSDVGSFR